MLTTSVLLGRTWSGVVRCSLSHSLSTKNNDKPNYSARYAELDINRSRLRNSSIEIRLANIAISRLQARCPSRLVEFAAISSVDTGSGLSREASAR